MSDLSIITKLVLVWVVVLLLFAIFITILGDVNWCVENYAPDYIPSCLYYENSLFGRYIQP